MHRLLLALSLAVLPTFSFAQSITFEDGPWIAIPAGMSFDRQMSPMEEIAAMANLDDDPSVTTEAEAKMIALLSQILGATPLE